MATILLVEPNVSFRRMMEQELRKAGHEVFGASEAFIAARALREREFDLVMIEMVIPGDMTAADLLAGLRDDPTPGDPARVAVTAQANFKSQESFFRAEYQLDGFLLKPFLPSALKKSAESALAAREARRNTPRMSEWAQSGFAPPPLDPTAVTAPVWTPAPAPADAEAPNPAARPASAPPPPVPVSLVAPSPLPAVPAGASAPVVVPARSTAGFPGFATPPSAQNAPRTTTTESKPASIEADPADVIELNPLDILPLETNPGLVDAPAPSASEFAAAASDTISLEDLAPPPQAVERRAVSRYPVRIPVAMHDGKAPFRARSENLGRGGIFVVTERAFPPGTPLRVRLELPIEGDGANEIAVRVTHSERVNDMLGMGLRFDDMSKETAQRVDNFLDQLNAPSQKRPFMIVASNTLSGEVERIAAQWRGEELRVRLVSPKDNAQEIAESDPPDLMVLDLADPVMVAFVGALKATRATSGIPVALVDKASEGKSALLAAAAGADRFFPLPGELKELITFSVEKLQASRRRSVRVRFQRPVSLWIAGAEFPAAAVDLSETGLQVRAAADLADGTPVELALALSDAGAPLRLSSRVMWRATTTDGATMGTRYGLAFEADEHTRSRIREEVRRALAASYYVRWLAAAPRVPKVLQQTR